ncbi:MAG: hypothetical protein R2815_09660 [Flavobacteriales bacterium]|nr:hypothetical protein [Flavobacteriales bacterium]
MRKPLKILLITTATVMALFIVLVVHIQLVTKNSTKHLANIQLARIDFDAPLDATEGNAIRSGVASLAGVQHAQVNAQVGNLVYSYDRAVQDQAAVLAAVQGMTDLPCHALVVTAEAAANGCPAMTEGGLQDRLGKWIAGLLN